MPSIPKFPDLPGWPWHLVHERLTPTFHGDYAKWQAAIDALPSITDRRVEVGPCVTVHGNIDSSALQQHLMMLHPWRKGPFQIGDVYIDTEWRSDLKWERIQDKIDALHDRRVLDVGCGNGYFGWRMRAAGALEVVGIDPTILFCMQHRALQRYLDDPHNWVLPLGIEDIPTTTPFDSVFSMGVIYHRRDPFAHLQKLYALTRPGGQTIVESLIVMDDASLHPAQRYARMRNVWWLPSVADLVDNMRSAGFTDVQCVDVSATTLDEQRTTEWMRFESLAAALDPDDPSLTVEGYPAPRRAIVVGNRP